MVRLDVDFYSRNTENVARDLLGKKLVRMYHDGSGKLKRLSANTKPKTNARTVMPSRIKSRLKNHTTFTRGKPALVLLKYVHD